MHIGTNGYRYQTESPRLLNMPIRVPWSSFIGGVILWVSCIAVHAADSDRIEFNRDVRPILSDKCFFCHGPDTERREADLRLDVRQSAIEAGAIKVGEPNASELIRRLLTEEPEERMPPAASKLGTLSASEVDILKKWIAQGAEYQSHWSFNPLTPIELPEASESNHPIDRLVISRLNQQGLTLQPEADRTTLARRVSFDLTGLPPTASEVAQFVNDPSSDAYERMVDRLLASKRYGERMAVDWLDVARYADSYGFQVDREREMWPWRDWVVRALNDNLPYDQFITWQLAGDLLPNASDDQVLATAFQRLHQQESEGGSVEEEYRVEYVCDRVQTFATAFLGLTFECARCHNHKYDPVTQQDFYGLFAMFQNIDEAGLYSFFTPSPPTPTLGLADANTKSRLQSLQQTADSVAARAIDVRTAAQRSWEEWLAGSRALNVDQLREQLSKSLERDLLGRFEFDKRDGDKLENVLDKDKPAKVRGENQLVPGHDGMAIEFTGDDAVDLAFGNFARHEPFSISLWMKTPDVKERAVVLHRSRAWTDAASRGYELLIEEGRLKWSLIHFWPGNAISIRTQSPIPVEQWQHVTVTYDGSSHASGLKLFLNGQAAAVDVVKDGLTKEITGGGGDNIALGERFRDRGFKGGAIDGLRVYAREVTSLEAMALFDVNATAEGLHGLLASDSVGAKDNSTPSDKGSPKTISLERWQDYYLANQSESWKQHLDALKTARAEWMKAADKVNEIMVMRELEQPKPAYILIRGEYAQRGQPVTANVPEWLLPLPEGAPKNRLGVAKWLTDPKHPLTARVAVNRIWQSLFGRGLVRTSEDFGSQGARPLYPEVLDWLAYRYIASGWDTKALIKTIVTSRVYRQRSWSTAVQMADDPDNEWLARGSRFRLPAEMIRDNALAASGLLKESIGGPPVAPYEMSEAFKPTKASEGSGALRRSLYTNWRRTGPPPAMIAFDAPRRAVCIAKRERTDSPLQALILLNGVQYVEAARAMGEAIYRESDGDVEAMIQNGAMRCLSRRVDEKELSILKSLYQEQLKHFEDHKDQAAEFLKIGSVARDSSIPEPQAAAATVLAQALLNHDECVVRR